MDSNRHGDWPLESKVTADCSSSCRHRDLVLFQIYIGDLGEDATRHEIEESFEKFGRVNNIWVAKRPPGLTT